ncbi:metal-dependent hydrolase [Corynebacterium pacaense]|uniref:metal-dependent hydrolase n=1 Tax=Corynebacterium pacaense TaxID=1816684 RepID=UPI0009B967AE|nr:metal-dependent hydrolase [Corynebacterium pacaense]
MVMGPTHAMSGAAVGLAVAQILPGQWGGVDTAGGVIIYAGLTAGAALLPDLDSPQATVSRSFGPLTGAISRFTENTTQAIVNATRGRRDPRCNNGHRTFTHTLWSALAAGAGATALIGAYGRPAAIGLLFFLLGLGIRGLLPEWSGSTDWIIVTAVAAALACGAWYLVPAGSFEAVLGSAVTVGCLTHLLGDMATRAGIPLFAPLVPIGGRRWWKVKLPGGLGIRANGPADKVLLLLFTLAVIAQLGLVFADGPQMILPEVFSGATHRT